MNITRTWQCPRCNHEKRLSSFDDTPDECEKCHWPKPERKEQKAKHNPDDWPAL